MSLFDVLFILLIGFFLASILIIIDMGFNPIMNALNSSKTTNNSNTNAIVARYYENEKSHDFMFVLIFFGFALGAVVSAYFLPTHPVFFFPILLIMVLGIFLAPTIANAFGSLITDPTVAQTANDYPLTTQIFQHLPNILLAIAIIIVIATMAKPPGFE